MNNYISKKDYLQLIEAKNRKNHRSLMQKKTTKISTLLNFLRTRMSFKHAKISTMKS